jgi:hypothetical protein
MGTADLRYRVNGSEHAGKLGHFLACRISSSTRLLHMTPSLHLLFRRPLSLSAQGQWRSGTLGEKKARAGSQRPRFMRLDAFGQSVGIWMNGAVRPC